MITQSQNNMADFAKNVDKYALQARVFPASLGLVFFVLLYALTVKPAFEIPYDLFYGSLEGVVAMASLFLWVSVIRSIGKFIVQYILYKGETNMPTTYLLMPNDMTLAPSLKAELEKSIQERQGKSLEGFVHKYADDDDTLKKEIKQIVYSMRQVTRNDNFLKRLNIDFGFWRNFSGTMLLCIAISICALLVDYSSLGLVYGKVILFFLAVSTGLFSIGLILTWQYGKKYALQLVRSYVQDENLATA